MPGAPAAAARGAGGGRRGRWREALAARRSGPCRLARAVGGICVGVPLPLSDSSDGLARRGTRAACAGEADHESEAKLRDAVF